jgi:CO dehydrogenase/acetyl-CoA synthase alpha subunit
LDGSVKNDKPSEFENFDRTMRDLISVPHDEIKAALDAEKAEKQKKKRKAKKPSAVARADGGED